MYVEQSLIYPSGIKTVQAPSEGKYQEMPASSSIGKKYILNLRSRKFFKIIFKN
jgi:hypothetical protein